FRVCRLSKRQSGATHSGLRGLRLWAVSLTSSAHCLLFPLRLFFTPSLRMRPSSDPPGVIAEAKIAAINPDTNFRYEPRPNAINQGMPPLSNCFAPVDLAHLDADKH